jgi:hypothetical protein
MNGRFPNRAKLPVTTHRCPQRLRPQQRKDASRALLSGPPSCTPSPTAWSIDYVPCPCHRQRSKTGAGSSESATMRINHRSLVVGVQQVHQIFGRPQVSLDLPTLALHSGPLDLRLGEGLRLDREACRGSSSAASSLDIGDILKVMAPS